MKQEDKELLLKDLCSMLPYGVVIEYNNDGFVETREMGLGSLHDFMFDNAEVKPYLRPMSSMTEKEFEEYGNIIEHISIGSLDFNIANPNAFDWLNAHHFDYRGLIEKGLAIEVTESNNPYEQNKY